MQNRQSLIFLELSRSQYIEHHPRLALKSCYLYKLDYSLDEQKLHARRGCRRELHGNFLFIGNLKKVVFIRVDRFL
ncbi:hypothetical protein MUK42_10764 [Musa troglodytarum]|uniref:Uncharacterized protein n=1 Tax=Musa troglodytarum TaxID=320322 RepID=A0A9E7KGG8_9LILI|nr:hypothetical protein MUK42_10764 [Musa troglodytarum]